MNTNRIKSDGFSNPATQRYFVENWSDDRYCEDSAYCYETLDGSFSCPGQDPYPEDTDDDREHD